MAEYDEMNEPGLPIQGMAGQPFESPMQEGMETAPEQSTENEASEVYTTDIRRYIELANLAEELDEHELDEIGSRVVKGYETDKLSRSKWEKEVEEWTKLASQVREERTFPWPGASNIKYPLLSTAAMQFSARAYPSLLPANGQVVKSEVIGYDPQGQKAQRAERVSKFMSYQLINKMESWEEDMDKLLLMLPIVGTIFKKTYWDPVSKENCSEVILPKDLVVNYWTKEIEQADRITHVIRMAERQLREKQLAGVFMDIELPDPIASVDANIMYDDDTTPYVILEQHTYLDLDEDGYEEPYIVTVEKESRKVLRIAARFDNESVEMNNKGEVSRIVPIQYFTKYGFIPNPDGGFYDIGFGLLLGPINESINTLINQLVDSGSISNLQSGFIGKGLRIKMGEGRFRPGEWKAVNATGDDLKKQIFPLPVREPSTVLFQLMGSLVSSGKELASIAEIFVGKMPGQNTPATTTMATVEQGMKVFTAVYKRIYRSLKKELKKLYRLNGIYLNPNTYVEILDAAVGPEDFKQEGYDICPAADPTAVSQTEKLVKAQGLMEMLALGTLDPMKVTERVLEAQEQPNWQELIAQPKQPPPDPKMLELQQKAQNDQQKIANKAEADQFKHELQQRDQTFQHAMEMERLQAEESHAERMRALEFNSSLHASRAQLLGEQAKHAQKLQQNDEAHRQKVQQAKEQPKSQSPNSSTGKTSQQQKKSSR